MSTQPRALMLADQLKERFGGSVLPSQAAAELRRLQGLNADLLKACQQALYALKGREHDGFLRDAIAKATGKQP